MAGSTWGTILKMTTWGESHGKGVGVVVDGCPAGLPLEPEDIQRCLNRRKPGQSAFATQRKEGDQVEILSGVFEGKTTGTPISMVVWNQDQRSHDYRDLMDLYRPGHADFTFDQKYGFRDYRGGGRSSGRETIARVAAGAIASKLLQSLGIQVMAYTQSVGEIKTEESRFDREEIFRNPLCMPDAKAAKEAEEYLKVMMAKKDSVGGVIACQVTGLPAGIGEPVFDKLDASLAKAIMSIGAIKGVEIGDGFQAAKTCGSANNDSFCMGADGHSVEKRTNHSGGVLGGISDGSTLMLRAAVKPTPSISSMQQTITRSGEETETTIKGRHDPIIVPRAVVVVEMMTAFTIADLLLQNMTARLDKVQKFYQS